MDFQNLNLDDDWDAFCENIDNSNSSNEDLFISKSNNIKDNLSNNNSLNNTDFNNNDFNNNDFTNNNFSNPELNNNCKPTCSDIYISTKTVISYLNCKNLANI